MRFFIILFLLFSSVCVGDEAKQTLPIDELKKFSDIFTLIKQNYVDEVSDSDLINSAIKGMLAGLDPHSTFLTDEDYKNLEESTSGHFGGVGLEVTMENGFVKVISPIADSPAAEAGIESGDLIIRINEQSIQGLSLDEAVKLMRGKPDTEVEFSIIRKGNDVPKIFTLTRQLVKTASVRSKRIEDDYAYIYVSQFQLPTGNDVRQAILKLQKKEPIKGLILDLRNNPGGVLTGAINVSDAFLNDGVIVSTKGRNKEAQSSINATPGDIINGLPIIVLINSGSASASEIVAGALQDNQRAIIMGSTSFGKGSVQNVLELNDNTGVKLTTARYYTPNDKSIQAKGIVPDIVVERLKVENKDQSGLKITEASLKGHLDNPDDKKKEKKKKSNLLATKDYVLYEAVNLLKALSIVNKK